MLLAIRCDAPIHVSRYAPIKFNGQAFNCNNTGKGWDARDWGAAYWW